MDSYVWESREQFQGRQDIVALGNAEALCADLHLNGLAVGAYVRGMVDDRYSTDPGRGPCLQSHVLGQAWFLSDTVASILV